MQDSLVKICLIAIVFLLSVIACKPTTPLVARAAIWPQAVCDRPRSLRVEPLFLTSNLNECPECLGVVFQGFRCQIYEVPFLGGLLASYDVSVLLQSF